MKKIGSDLEMDFMILANEEIHNIMIGDNDSSHKII